jgi:hypothetical protein
MKTLALTVLAALIGISIYVSRQALAQGNFGVPAQSAPYKEFEQHGNLVDIKMVPAGKETRIYFVGKEAGKLSTDKISVTGRLKNGDKEKDITLRKFKEYFSTEDSLEGESLHVKARMEDIEKDEEFHFNLKKH